MSKNPFDAKPTTQNKASNPMAGFDPLAGLDEVPEQPSLMREDVIARVAVERFYVDPPAPKKGTYVYVYLRIVEVGKDESALPYEVGQIVAHRIGGFESLSREKALRAVKQLVEAIDPSVKESGASIKDTVSEWHSDNSPIVGKEFWIQTRAHTTQSKDDSGNLRVIVKGEYQPLR